MNCLYFLAFCMILPGGMPAAETVVMRTANGRFLRPTPDRTLRADSFVPGENESFELISRGNGQYSLKTPGNRWLAPDTRDGRTPYLTGAGTETGRWTLFDLMPAGDNRTAFRSLATGRILLLDPAAGRPTASPMPPGLPPSETIRLFCPHPLPSILKTAVPAVVNGLAEKELAGKQYDKTWRHKTEQAVKVPDPTLKNPFRTKKQHLYAVVEESTVQAQLNGKTDVRLPATLFLAERNDGKQGIILLAVEAHLPVRGRVQYQMLNVMSASTNYYTTIHLFAVAEIPVRQTDKEITISPAKVKHLEVNLSDLKLANDLLHAARAPIERTINGELRRNDAKIRQKADEALAKALSSKEVKIPLLGFLKLL